MGTPGYGGSHQTVYCRRCNRELRVATTMDYDYQESKQLKLRGITACKIYLVCNNCYKGEWVDSRGIQYDTPR